MALGTVWADDTWDVDAWEDNTWADVSSDVTVSCTVGNAVAAGSTATITQFVEVTISCSVGNAVAAGATATITQYIDVTIACSVGNAVAAGLTATITNAAGAIARPNADTTVGAWLPITGAVLYDMINEPAPPDAADYIYATSSSTCKIQLSPVADPATSSGQVVSYQAWSPAGDGLTVRLMQGAVQIAAWVHASLPTTATIYQQALSAGECNAITDYADLFIQFES